MEAFLQLEPRHIIVIASCTAGGGWYVRHRNRPCDGDQQYGETLLIAACRSIVAAKLGRVVQIPAELIGEGGAMESRQ